MLPCGCSGSYAEASGSPPSEARVRVRWNAPAGTGAFVAFGVRSGCWASHSSMASRQIDAMVRPSTSAAASTASRISGAQRISMLVVSPAGGSRRRRVDVEVGIRHTVACPDPARADGQIEILAGVTEQASHLLSGRWWSAAPILNSSPSSTPFLDPPLSSTGPQMSRYEALPPGCSNRPRGGSD